MTHEKTMAAFPNGPFQTGMALRDWLAGQALPIAWDAYDKGYYQSTGDQTNRDIAACAYQMADAMIAARSA